MSEFRVRWLDGREETLHLLPRYDDDYAEDWAEQRERGAVGLLEVNDDGTVTWRDHGYTTEILEAGGLGLGCHVRHRRHPELEGRVVGFEWKGPDRLSIAPLRVYWDDDRAREKLGWFSIYPSPESLEPLAGVPA